MEQTRPFPSIVRDTAPPPLRPAPPYKPTISYVNKSVTEAATRVFNASVHSVNVTLRNASHRVAAAVNHTAKSMNRETTPVAQGTALRTTTTTTTMTAVPWSDDLNKMTTTSVSERASHLSLLHLFAWFLLFTTLTMTTVVLLNWCLRSRQASADSKENGEDEEMSAKAFVQQSSSSAQGMLAEGLSSTSSSSNRLLASRGNLARQQFLESRKAGGNVKNYGGTGTA
jgi:hypothetical protein